MNMVPVRVRLPGKSQDAHWTTSLELFYGIIPDYRVLFPWGCLGYFRRTRDGNHTRDQFEAQAFVGICLGRSDFSNGMLFFNPDTKDFVVSGDYRLDISRSIQDAFPSQVYDGGCS